MLIKPLGTTDYRATWQKMRDFTDRRSIDEAQPDEIWLTEHEPVYTLGLAADPAHVLHNCHIPCVRTDRGGQVTYHGPGQSIVYPLIDLRRHRLKVREYVHLLETIAIRVLGRLGVADAFARPDAPGVYVPQTDGSTPAAKIAALGIKVRHGAAYHGLAINVNMDLGPFANINPCGHAGQQVTDLLRLGVTIDANDVAMLIAKALVSALRRNGAQFDL
jgi:lipoyl(octanoyl) transferase